MSILLKKVEDPGAGTSPTRRGRATVLVAVSVAALAGSFLVASPASAAADLVGIVYDAGTPVANVNAGLYKYNDARKDWDTYSSATTGADGKFTIAAPTTDGAYAFFYDVSSSPAAFSTNQGWDGSLDDDLMKAQFAVTGGVASVGTFTQPLIRNAGVVSVILRNGNTGTLLTGDIDDGQNAFYLGDNYSPTDGYLSGSGSASTTNLNATGTLTASHILAGAYYYGYIYGEDADGHDFGSEYVDALAVTPGSTQTIDVTLYDNTISPYVSALVPNFNFARIAGVPKVGALLTVSEPGIAVNTKYQWFTDGSPIVGATTPSYVPTKSDIGNQLYVRAIVRAPGHTTGYYTTDQSKPVAVGDPNAATVAVSGTAKFGGTLKATVSSPLPESTTAYQWYRNGSAVLNADGSTFTLGKADINTSITVGVKSTVQGHTDAVIPSTAVLITKETVSLKATTDKSIKTSTKPKVKVTVKPSASDLGTTARVRVYYTSTKYKSVSVKTGSTKTVTLPKLKKGTTTLKIVYPGTAYYAAKTVTIKVKVKK